MLVVKNHLSMQETLGIWVGSLGGEDPLEEETIPLQDYCLGKPMDRGAWWAMVHGVTKSRTQLRDFMQAVRMWNICKGCKHHSEEALLRNGIDGLGFLTLFAYLYFSLSFQNHTMKSQAGIRSAVNMTGSYIRFAQTVNIPQCGGHCDV